METRVEYVLSGEYRDGLAMDEDEVEEMEEGFKAVLETFETRNQSQDPHMLL